MLLIPSPWGLTPSLKRRADELADAGFSILAPDLNDGRVASDQAEADEILTAMDMNVAASMVQSSARLLERAANPDAPGLGAVGFAAGASWALWLSARLKESCACVVGFYGTQSIEFDGSQSSYLLHFGTADTLVNDEEIAHLGLSLQLARRPFSIEQHQGAAHGFAEAEHPNFNAGAEAIAWRQTLEFLATTLRTSDPAR